MLPSTFYLSSTITHYPDFPYQSIKNTILGRVYELSLTFIGPDRARRLNQKYRHKDYIPNVLSFPLTTTSGEIYICPSIAYPEAKDYFLSQEGYIAFLFIHGCLHLKGHDHSDTMESLERRFMKRFAIV